MFFDKLITLLCACFVLLQWIHVAIAAPTTASMHSMCTGADDKYFCTHDQGAYRFKFKCITLETRTSTTTTSQGVAPTCSSGLQACCCDSDGDCTDGTDDWCCPNSLPAQHMRGQCIESSSQPHFCSNDDFIRSGRTQCKAAATFTATATTANQQPVCPATSVPACCCDIDDDCTDGT